MRHCNVVADATVQPSPPGKERKSQEMGSTGLSGAAVSSEHLGSKEIALADSARSKGSRSSSALRIEVAKSVSPPSRRAPARSNLIDVLIAAREEEFRSIPNLAAMAGITPAELRRLEAGKGSVATLISVFEALPFQITGLGPGRTLGEQLRRRRERRGKAVAEVAAKASLSSKEVLELEADGGSVENLLRLLAVIAPKVSRRAPERAHWGKGDKLDRDSRFTPEGFLEAIYKVFGPIDLDPCGHLMSPVVARRRFILAQGDDGLRDPWFGRLAFMNPPYSELLIWLSRAHEQWEAGNVGTVLCLVPVRTDSDFFHTTLALAADIYLLRRRLKFLSPDGKKQQTPFSLMLVTLGATAQQKMEFLKLVPGLWMRRDERFVETEQKGTIVDLSEFRKERAGSRLEACCVRSGGSGLNVLCGPSAG
jgi:transcriptional regulator with XRE-family HTH domain